MDEVRFQESESGDDGIDITAITTITVNDDDDGSGSNKSKLYGSGRLCCANKHGLVIAAVGANIIVMDSIKLERLSSSSSWDASDANDANGAVITTVTLPTSILEVSLSPSQMYVAIVTVDDIKVVALPVIASSSSSSNNSSSSIDQCPCVVHASYDSSSSLQKVCWDLDDKLLALFTDSITIIDPNSTCLLYTSPSPRDRQKSRMPSSA